MDTSDQDNTLAERTGPFYSLVGLCEWLNKSEDWVFKKVQYREILAASTVDGIMLFPVWQFEEDGSVNADLQKAIKVLYSAEPKVSFESKGKLLPGACWFTLSFLTLDYPFTLPTNVSTEQKDAERLPLYRHLRNGYFVEEIMWEVNDQAYRMTSP